MMEATGMTGPDIHGAFGTGRVSGQRRAIAETAACLPGAFSVDDLVAAVSADGGSAGVATVYRAVTAMLASGWLERVGEREGRALFLRCGTSGHHHHVVCDGCGRVEATACPVVVGPADEAGAAFLVTRHEVALYGLCPECAAAAGAGETR
jgi:Fur family ferric uptake transcriptional regulator